MTTKPAPLTLEEVAASLGEQIRRLEQLMVLVRMMAKRQGLDWKALTEATERAMWSEAERAKLRGGNA